LLAEIRECSNEILDPSADPVGFLPTRDKHRVLVQAAAQLSESSLAAVWDNPKDDVYNDL
jgi:hypothetical protein